MRGGWNANELPKKGGEGEKHIPQLIFIHFLFFFSCLQPLNQSIDNANVWEKRKCAFVGTIRVDKYVNARWCWETFWGLLWMQTHERSETELCMGAFSPGKF